MDNFDASGLMPDSAPWPMIPDQGMEASTIFFYGWNAPRYGGDVSNTTAYPSQEPAPVEWPRIPPMSAPTTDTGQGG